MRKRGVRPLKELYDLTDRIAQPEITPVLEGSCRIQGPVDEPPDHELARTNLCLFPTGKRYAFVNENLRPRTESGTCNMCSAPCSSCMHLNQNGSCMESNADCLFPGNTFEKREDDSCSSIGVGGLPFYESRTCDKNRYAASETNNLASISSSHDSYSENSESKAAIRALVTYEASDAVDMPSRATSSAFRNDLPKKANTTTHSIFSSQSHMISDIGCKIFSSPDEEQRGSEVHGDNISCITAVRDANAAVIMEVDKICSSASTSSSLAKSIEDEVQIEAACGFHDHKTEENQSSSRSPSISDKESLQKKTTCPILAESGISDKPGLAEFPPSENSPSNVQSLCFNSQKGYLFHHNDNSKDLEGNPSSQVQAEIFECSMDNVKSSSRGLLAADSAHEQKSTPLQNCENNKASCTRSDNSSAAPRDIDPSFKTEIPTENSNALMETSYMQVSQAQAKPNVEDENSESDIGLEDVKVCDTCGDAGREVLLAICSRCSDGAEHTYCMRKKLDKLPEGDWLCEECKNKEDTEILKADKSESVFGTSKPTCFNDKNQNFVNPFNRKVLPKLNTKTVDQETRVVVKGLQSSQVSSTRHGETLVDSSVTSKKASEASSRSTGTASPRKETVLSREISFKSLDIGKAKQGNLGSSFGGQSVNNTPILSRLQTSLGSKSFKVQARLQSPRVPVFRSHSFNNSNLKPNPRVKQLTENVPYKLKPSRESTSIDSGKVGLSKTMAKSSSFRRGSSDPSNIEPVGKTQSLVSSRSEDSSGSKQVKEIIAIQKKKNSVNRHPSPQVDMGIHFQKVDLKVAQYDVRLKNTSKSKGLSISKVSDDGNDAGCKEEKKQLPSKNFGSHSSDAMCNSVDQKPFQVSKDGIRANFATNDRSCSKANANLQSKAAHAAESVLREHKTEDPIVLDDKTKESSPFRSSKQVVSGESGILHCQRCNEAGHATHFCSCDELRASALMPSADRNLREGIKKRNKWKDAVEATYMQKNNKLPDQSEEFESISANLSCKAKIFSSCSRDLPVLEGRTDHQETVTGSDAEPCETTDIDTRQQTMHPVEASHVHPVNDSNYLSVSDESNVKSSVHNFPDQTSMYANSLRASAVPELDFIWQGGFEVMRTGRLPELFDGIQAHLSTCASPKIPEVATKFPCKVQLEEVPRMSSWPSQFQRSSPKKDSIALFFFAKDIESYEKNYSKLLENMLTNDLALRGNIDGVELLIFTSNTLPANSQCWNMLYFLWGVFRGRRMDCLEAVPGSQNKPCQSIPSTDPFKSHKIDLMESRGMELSWCDRSSEVMEVISTASVDCWPTSSSRVDDSTCSAEVFPLVRNYVYQAAVDRKLPSDHTSFPVNCSSKNMNQLHPNLLNSCPETKFQSNAKLWCPEGNSGAVYMKSLDEEDNYVLANPDSLNYRQGVDGSRSEEKTREKEKSMKREADLDDDRREYLAESNPHIVLHASSETPGGIVGSKVWMKKINSDINFDAEREYKKMKRCGEGYGSSSFGCEYSSGRTSTMVQPLLGSFLNHQQHRDSASEETWKLVNSGGAERCSFSMASGPVTLDDEDMSQSHAPLLKLSLGGEKKSREQKELSLLFPLGNINGCLNRPSGPAEDDDEQPALPLLFPLDRNGNQERPHGTAVEDDATLSLSLGLPSTRAKPIFKSEQLMHGEPHVNTSLLLFSGFHDA